MAHLSFITIPTPPPGVHVMPHPFGVAPRGPMPRLPSTSILTLLLAFYLPVYPIGVSPGGAHATSLNYPNT